VAEFPVGARSRDGFGDAEVRDHRGAAREQHVVGLDVAVHDAAIVRVRERARHVTENAHGFAGRERAAFAEPCAETFSLDERHREVQNALRVPGIQHRYDIGLLQRRGDPDFALESLGAEAGSELRGKNFDHDAAAESPLFGDEDARHAAPAELVVEGVRAAQIRLEVVAECHCGRRRARRLPAPWPETMY